MQTYTNKSRLLKASVDNKRHVRLFKKGKFWVSAGVSVIYAGVLFGTKNQVVAASTVTSSDATSQATSTTAAASNDTTTETVVASTQTAAQDQTGSTGAATQSNEAQQASSTPSASTEASVTNGDSTATTDADVAGIQSSTNTTTPVADQSAPVEKHTGSATQQATSGTSATPETTDGTNERMVQVTEKALVDATPVVTVKTPMTYSTAAVCAIETAADQTVAQVTALVNEDDAQAATSATDTIVNNAALHAVATHQSQERATIAVLTAHTQALASTDQVAALQALTSATSVLNTMNQELAQAAIMVQTDKQGVKQATVAAAQTALMAANFPAGVTATVDAYGDLILTAPTETDYDQVVTSLTQQGLIKAFRAVVDPVTAESAPTDDVTTELHATVGNLTKIYDGETALSENPTVTLANGGTVPYLNPIDFDWSQVQANAGTYTVTLSASGIAKILAANPNSTLTASDITAGTVTVRKKNAMIQAGDQYKEVGDDDPALTAKVTGATVDQTLDYSLTRDVGETLGVYAIHVTVANDAVNQNYNIRAVDGTLYIVDPSAAVELSGYVGDISKQYDGTATFTKVPTLTMDDGEVVPTLTAADFNYAGIGTDVGKYAVSLNTQGIAKLLAANPGATIYPGDIAPGDATVTPAPATIKAVAATKAVGTADPVLTAIVSGAANGDQLDYTLTRAAGETVGTYKITVAWADGDPDNVNANYNISGINADFTITAGTTTALSATVGDISKAYDGQVTFTQVPTVTLSNNAVVPTLTSADFDYSAATTAVGTYTVTLNDTGIAAIMAANPDTSLAPASITAGIATVTKAAVTITAASSTKTSGEADPPLTATVSGAVAGETINYTLTRQAGEVAGAYAITVTAPTDGVNANYAITTVPGTLTISVPTATALTATVGAVSRVYNGTTMFDQLPAVTLSNGATVPTLTAADFDFSQVQANVGTYTLTLSASGLAAIMAANAGTTLAASAVTAGSAVITPANATLTIAAATKAVGDADPQLTATATGVVSGETLAYTLSRVSGETAGTYAITATVPTTGVNANYAITVVPAALTITASTKTAIQASVGNVQKNYNGTTSLPTMPVVSLSGNAVLPYLTQDDFAFSASPINVGTYTVTLSDVGIAAIEAANPTMSLSSTRVTSGTLTIAKAKATIAANALTVDEGDAQPTLTATVTGAENGDVLDYVVTRTSGNTVGTYQMTVSVANTPVNANYQITTEGATYTIVAHPVTHLKVTIGDVSTTYNGTATITAVPTVTFDQANLSPFPLDSPLDFVYAVGNGNVGTYSVTLSADTIATLLAYNPYTVIDASDISTGTITITPAAATITADAVSKPAGSADPALTATVTGVVGNDVLNYSLARDTGETEGTYAINVTAPATGVNQNYSITTAPGVFTITAATSDPLPALTATVGSATKTYDGTTSLTTLPVVTADHNAVVPALTAADFDLTQVVADVGTYVVTLNATGITAILAANPNTTLAPTAVTAGSVTITPAPATITVLPATKNQGAADPVFNTTVTGTVAGDQLNYTVSRTAGETVGTYPLTVTLGTEAVNQNYAITSVPNTLTITPDTVTALTATIGNLSKVYDGTTDFTDVPTVTLRNVATVPALTTADFDFSAVARNVGTYTLTLNAAGIAKIEAANPNTTLAASAITAGTVTISKAAATITANNLEKAVGAADPELTAAVSGSQNRDILTYTLARAAGETAGTYAITVSAPTTGINANYDLTLVPGTFTITTPPTGQLVATVGNVTKIYDGTTTFATLPTVTLDGDAVVPTLTADDFTYSGLTADVGTYSVTLSAAGIAAIEAANDGATLDPAAIFGGAAVIQAATVLKVIVADFTAQYNGTTTNLGQPGVTVIGTTNVPALTVDDFNWGSVTPAVGTYTVMLSQAGMDKILAANPGSTLLGSDIMPGLGGNITPGILTITKAPLTITANDATKVVGAVDPVLTATAPTASAEAPAVYTVTRVAGETPGQYAISVTANPSDNPNYDMTTIPGTFTITTATETTLTATVGNVTKTYDGTASFSSIPVVTLTPTATLPTLTASDFTISHSGTNVGSYAITLSAAGIAKIAAANPDLSFSANDVSAGTATITKAPVTIQAENATKATGSVDPTLEATVIGAVAGEQLGYTLTRPAAEASGVYAITVVLSDSAVNDNYQITALPGTLTITATVTKLAATVGDLSKTYDGTTTFVSIPTVSLSAGTTTPTFTADDFTYQGMTADVGTYAVTLSAAGLAKINAANPSALLVAGDITAGRVTITPAAVTIQAQDATKVAGTTDPQLTATVTGAIGSDQLAYTLTRAAGEIVGEYAITVTPDTSDVNDNYEITTVPAILTITAAPVTILTATVGNLTKIYDGTTTFNDVPAVTLSDGATVPALGIDDFAFNALTADAGTYTVALSASGIAKIEAANANTSLTANDVVAGTAAITKAAVTIQAQDADKVAGTTDPQLTATVTGAIGRDQLAYTVTRVTGEDVGTYVITVTPGTGTVNSNYDITTVPATFTITAAPVTALTATVGNLTKIYDGTTDFGGVPVVTLSQGATVPALVADDFDFTEVTPDAGTYTVTLSAAGIAKIEAANANTSLAVSDVEAGTATISKAAATIQAQNATKLAGGVDPTFAATVNGTIAGNQLTYTLSRVTGEAVGSYAINVTLGSSLVNDNYQVTTLPGTLTITAIPITALTATVGNITKAYDGTTSFAQLPVVTLSDNGSVPTLVAADFTFTGLTANAGTYSISLSASGITKLEAANPHTSLATSAITLGTVTITKAAATIQAVDATKVEEGVDPILQATVSGAVADDQLAYTVTRAPGETVGTYAITVTPGSSQVNNNYQITTVSGTFTITAIPVTALTATVGNITKTYDGTTSFASLPTITLSATATMPELVASDFNFVGLEADAGTYQITLTESGIAKIEAANPHMTLASSDITSGTATITKAVATIQAQNVTKVEGEADPTLVATVTGAVSGEQLQYTLTRASGEAVGNYVITVTPTTSAVNDNYQITTVSGTFAITAIPTTALTATVGNLTKSYDGTTTFDTQPVVTLSNGEVVTDLTDADFDYSQIEANEGRYSITLNTTGRQAIEDQYPHTTVAAADVTAGAATITPAAAIITVQSVTKTQGTADPAYTATVSGTVDGDVLDYTVTRAAGEAVGVYNLTVTLADTPVNANYAITIVPGTLRITTPEPTVLHVTVEDHTAQYDGTMTDLGWPVVDVSGATEQVTLTYDDFDWSQVSPNVGSYALTLSAAGIAKIVAANPNTTLSPDDVTAGTLTITKAPLTITANNNGKVEGTADPILTARAQSYAHGTAVVYSVQRAAGEAVGEYAINVTAAADANPNYDITTVAGVFTITAPAVTELTAALADYTITYSGASDQFGTPNVTLSDNAVVPDLTAADFDWSAVRPEVGTYSVALSAAGIAKILAANPNTSLTSATITPATLTITKAPLTITAIDASKVAGQADPELTVRVQQTYPAGVSPIYTVSRVAGEAPGEYVITVTAQPADNPDYDVTTVAGTFTITPAAATVLSAAVGDVTKVFDGTTAFTDLPAVTLDHDAVVPPLSTADFDWSAVTANAGEYQVTLSAAGIAKIIAANANTTLAGTSVTAGTATITRAPVTLTVTSLSKTEGSTDPAFSATVSGMVGDDELDYLLSRQPGEALGDYTITATLATSAVNANYQVAIISGKLSITAPESTPLQVMIANFTATYDGTTSHLGLPAVTLNGGNMPTLTAADFDWTQVAPAVGTYEVTLSGAGIAKILAANPNTTLVSNDIQVGQLTITKAPLTITANDATKVAGTPDPTLSAHAQSYPQGLAPVYTVSRTAGETPGEYVITVTADAAANPDYDITTVPGTFTITAVPTITLEATVGALTKTYDGTTTFATLPTVTLSDGATLPTLTTSDFDFTQVDPATGTYAVTLSVAGVAAILAANPNTTLPDTSITPGQAIITPAEAQLVVQSETKFVDQSDPEFRAVVTGTVAGEQLAYTLTRTPGDTVGSYVITASLQDTTANNNYHVTIVPGTLKIEPLPVTALTVELTDFTATYNGTNEGLGTPGISINGATVIPTLTAADFDWSAVAPAVGTYEVTLSAAGISKILAANPNTSLSSTAITAAHLTITKAPLKIIANNAGKVAGQVDPPLTATAQSYEDGTAAVYTVSRAAGETPGDYAITVDAPAEANPNYEITTIPGVFTITAAPIALTAKVGSLTKQYDGTTTVTSLPQVSLSDGATVPPLTSADFDLSQVETGVGTYQVTLNEVGVAALLAANPGMTLALTDVTAGALQISPAPATITARSATKQAGTSDPTLSAVVSGTVGGDQLNYSVSRVAGEDVGTYAITVSAPTTGVNANYDITTVPATLTITAQPTTALTATIGKLTRTYDGSLAFASLPTVTLSAGAITPTLTAADFDFSQVKANVGIYTVGLSEAGIAAILKANPQTTLVATDIIDGQATIEKATAVITANAAEKTAGKPDPTLTATVSGVVSGDQLDYTVARTAGEKAGTYAITVTVGQGDDNQNYAIKTSTALFTIKTAAGGDAGDHSGSGQSSETNNTDKDGGTSNSGNGTNSGGASAVIQPTVNQPRTNEYSDLKGGTIVEGVLNHSTTKPVSPAGSTDLTTQSVAAEQLPATGDQSSQGLAALGLMMTGLSGGALWEEAKRKKRTKA